MNEFVPREYWEKRLGATSGLEGVGYLGLGHYNDWLYKVKKAVFRRRMRSLGADFSTWTVLDVGCGTGFFLERWKELGVKKAAGIDITRVAVENLKRTHPDVDLYELDIGETVNCLPPGSFDAVSAFDVLYHIVDDEKYERAIANIQRLLKPGGLFIWSDNFIHAKTLRVTHQVNRSLERTERILSANRFQVLERVPLFYLMNAPCDSRNPIRKIVWRLVSTAAAVSSAAGFVIGAIQYPFERMLTSVAKESPTTEMMICRKSQ